MPRRIGATDPADLMAQTRAEMGLLRQLQQTRCVVPHPSRGGSSSYPVWAREEKIEKWYAGEATDVFLASLYCWEEPLHPHCQTGASARTTIVGVDMIHIVTFLTAHSNSTMDKMGAFIYNKGRGALFQ